MFRMLTALACLAAIAGSAGAQSSYSLGFNGPATRAGTLGQTWSGEYTSTIDTTLGDTDGTAQAWSLSMSADGAAITSITTDGTDAGAAIVDGFNKTEVTAAGIGGCEGRSGAISAIVLAFQQDVQLGAGLKSVARLVVEGTIPAGSAVARLRYADGCQGSGQPVSNRVTEFGRTVQPALGSLDIALRELVSCCHDTGKAVNLGFSGAAISSVASYDGIVDVESGTPLCDGAGGEIVIEQGDGTAGVPVHVYTNLSSQAAGGGIQGWALSVAVSGDVDIAGVTPDGLAAVDNNFSGGFKKTEAINPAAQVVHPGQRGVVSAVVLSFTEPRALPSTGTESVLDLTLSSSRGPAEGDDVVGSVFMLNNLRGSGQPVGNVVTVEGSSVNPCNRDTAGVSIVYRLVPPQVSEFIRGNANNDAKVDIGDAIWVLNELFKGGAPTVCRDAADANDDGMVDSGDAVYLINHQFAGGTAPPAPYPDCGTDPGSTVESCPAGSVTACP